MLPPPRPSRTARRRRNSAERHVLPGPLVPGETAGGLVATVASATSRLMCLPATRPIQRTAGRARGPGRCSTSTTSPPVHILVLILVVSVVIAVRLRRAMSAREERNAPTCRSRRRQVLGRPAPPAGGPKALTRWWSAPQAGHQNRGGDRDRDRDHHRDRGCEHTAEAGGHDRDRAVRGRDGAAARGVPAAGRCASDGRCSATPSSSRSCWAAASPCSCSRSGRTGTNPWCRDGAAVPAPSSRAQCRGDCTP